MPAHLNAVELVDQSGRQGAFYLPNKSLPSGFALPYSVQLGDYALHKEHFTLGDNRYVTLTEDVITCAELFLADHPRADATAVIRLVVDFLAQRFSYLHHPDELNRGELSCTLLEGDCLDINTAMMKLLRLKDIASAYYIGLFFEAPQHQAIDDWHCWVSTNAGQLQDWDIAHHLKRGLAPVAPALNPVAGIRVALSIGRGLLFQHQQSTFELSHFGAPMWCFPSGKTQQARFSAALSAADAIAEVAVC